MKSGGEVRRKLTAILAADVVAYSRLMEADERGTLTRLKLCRKEVVEPSIARHQGRIVKLMGDGALVEFPSVVEAVACAVEVQAAVAKREAGRPEEQRLRFRIGVNVGDVIIEGKDIYGDGVNVAARLQALAPPGGVCISDAVFQQIRGKLPYPFADVGEQSLKNLAHPVRAHVLSAETIATLPDDPPIPGSKKAASRLVGQAVAAAVVVLALIAGAVGLWWLRPATHASQAAAGDPEQPLSAPRLSIVVLPFANLSNDPEQEYFADGITEDLTTDLSLIPNLLVIARNTASTFKGKAIDVRQVGRELDVRYALEGSVHRTADDVRITAQLIDAERGTHVWADRIDGNVTRLSALQDEVTARLARALDVTLIDTESRRAELERPNNPDAIDFSMRGWAAANRPRSPESLASARDLFEKALRIDPQLVQAQVGLGYATSVAAMYRWSTDPKKDLMVANETILRALQASPNDAVAHLVHGDVFRAQRRFDDAIAEYERAVAENRNLAAAYAQIGGTRTLNGQAQEAFAPVEKAIRLSPRDPLLNVWLFYICHAHTHLAQDDDAIEWCRKSIAVAPFWLPYVDLAAAYGWKGEKREAQQAVEGLLKLMPGYTVQKWATAGWSDNPKFLIEYQRIVEGLRKAGLQEQ